MEEKVRVAGISVFLDNHFGGASKLHAASKHVRLASQEEGVSPSDVDTEPDEDEMLATQELEQSAVTGEGMGADREEDNVEMAATQILVSDAAEYETAVTTSFTGSLMRTTTGINDMAGETGEGHGENCELDEGSEDQNMVFAATQAYCEDLDVANVDNDKLQCDEVLNSEESDPVFCPTQAYIEEEEEEDDDEVMTQECVEHEEDHPQDDESCAMQSTQAYLDESTQVYLDDDTY